MRAIAAWFSPRRRVVAIALVGWVAVIVVGAGRTAAGDEWIRLPDLSNVILLAMGLYFVLGLLLLVSLRPHRTRPGSRRPVPLRSLVLGTIAVTVVVLLLGPQEVAEVEPTPETQPPPTEQPIDPAAGDDVRPGPSGGDLATLLILFLAVAALSLRSRKRTTATDPQGIAPRDQRLIDHLETAIDEAVLELELVRDPRLAVMAAYASLERALAEHGEARGPAETPSEHLGRALGVLPELTDPAVRLGYLYELARFSDHPITDADRMDARAALTRAQQVLVSVEVGAR